MGAESGVAPNVAPAFSVALELVAPSWRWPSVRIGGLLAQSLTTRIESADVRFRLLAARMDLCQTLTQGSHAGLAVCASVEWGELRGSATHVNQARDQFMPWLGVGPTGRAHLPLSRAVGIELDAGALGLAVRDHFILNPSVPIYQVPVIAWDILIGLRWLGG
jgi:hypothetical protein